MPGTLFVCIVVCLLLGYQVDCDVIVNINYDDQEGVSTCGIKTETTSCCNHRGLVVSGNAHNISDAQITASTFWGAGHEAHQARIFNIAEGGAWVPKDDDGEAWIQFNLGRPRTILAVVSRGRKVGHNQFVTSYKVKYTTTPPHCANWNMAFYKPAPEIAPTDLTMFPGNHDRDTLQVNFLEEAIIAQYVRIYPVTANQIHKSLRADLIGCIEC